MTDDGFEGFEAQPRAQEPGWYPYWNSEAQAYQVPTTSPHWVPEATDDLKADPGRSERSVWPVVLFIVLLIVAYLGVRYVLAGGFQ